MLSSCIALFISSPRFAQYKGFVKQKMAEEWFFPVWTLEELKTCHPFCYPNLSIETLKERHRTLRWCRSLRLSQEKFYHYTKENEECFE
jgi:hypothetical protein